MPADRVGGNLPDKNRWTVEALRDCLHGKNPAGVVPLWKLHVINIGALEIVFPVYITIATWKKSTGVANFDVYCKYIAKIQQY